MIIDPQHQLQLRRMVTADLDAIMAIEHSAYPFPWSEGIFRDCLSAAYSCWVLEHRQHALTQSSSPVEQPFSTVGYAIFSVAVGEMHILNLCVSPVWQGKGFGRYLLQHIQDKARQQGAEMCFLEVRESNSTAQQLYLSDGFNEVGFRKNYYYAGERREHAIVMAKQFESLLFTA
ncbi:MAG: ribosomal protein S18-alanine N-acetyltransferase [bacterium]